MKKIRHVYYKSIPDELVRLGLTQSQAAKLLGITRSTLNHNIKADNNSFHWQIYGLAHYLESQHHAHVK
jgi:predicted transcriptional regulator